MKAVQEKGKLDHEKITERKQRNIRSALSFPNPIRLVKIGKSRCHPEKCGKPPQKVTICHHSPPSTRQNPSQVLFFSDSCVCAVSSHEPSNQNGATKHIIGLVKWGVPLTSIFRQHSAIAGDCVFPKNAGMHDFRQWLSNRCAIHLGFPLQHGDSSREP